MADFYLTAAQQRANQIEAELAAAKADLAAYKANSDVESAGGTVQQIVNDYFGGKSTESLAKVFWRNSKAFYKWAPRG